MEIGKRALVVLSLFFSCIATAESPIFDGSRTWVFAIGLTEWQDSKIEAFEKDGRADEHLIAALRTRGVPRNQIVFLQDKAATKSAIATQLTALLKKTAAGDRLIFYFSGHGSIDPQNDDTYFYPYDFQTKAADGWYVSALLKQLNTEFKGDEVFLWIDACHSGAVADALPPDGAHHFVALTSTQRLTNSTWDWAFTEALAEGLLGEIAVDTDHDGWVTLHETAAYARREMAFDFGQMVQYRGDHKAFDDLRLAPTKKDLAPIPPKLLPWIGRHVSIETNDGEAWAKILNYDENGFWVRWSGFANDDPMSFSYVKTLDKVHAYVPKEIKLGAKILFYSYAYAPGHPSTEKIYGTVIGNWYGVTRVRTDDDKIVPRERWVGEDDIWEIDGKRAY